MLKIILTKGAPASSKSTWAKQQVASDPSNWLRINNDDLRLMTNGSVFDPSYEKMITDIRNMMISEGLRKNKNIILDNVNANKRHFEKACELAKSSGKDVMVMEKMFYCELEELIERDSKRTGTAQVGEEIVKKFWKELGGKQFKHYHVKTEVFSRNNKTMANQPITYDESLQDAIVCDLDGTVSLFNKRGDDGMVEIVYPGAHARNPYDASTSDQDMLNVAVAHVIKRFYKDGIKIIFCSGRKDDYRPQTESFLKTHFSDIEYTLLMRKSEDNRKDSIIKEEIFMENILGKVNVLFCLDDRDQVVRQYRSMGLTVFQVADGNF